MIDLLLPHGTWQFPPPGLPARHTPYADWLAAVFDRWYDAPRREVRVRLFDSLVDLHLGGVSSTEMWGAPGSDVVVVQPDGSIEQNDVLKAVHDDAARTGYDIGSHSFDQALAHPGFAADRQGPGRLAAACRRCPVVDICGGGLRAHRFRPGNGFDNPSCYCADLRALIEHVGRRVAESVANLTRTGDSRVTMSEVEPMMAIPADMV